MNAVTNTHIPKAWIWPHDRPDWADSPLNAENSSLLLPHQQPDWSESPLNVENAAVVTASSDSEAVPHLPATGPSESKA